MSTTVNTSDNNVSITQDTQTLTITDNSAGTSVDVNTTSTNAVTITDKNQFIYTANNDLVANNITAHGNIQTYGDIILEDSKEGTFWRRR